MQVLFKKNSIPVLAIAGAIAVIIITIITIFITAILTPGRLQGGINIAADAAGTPVMDDLAKAFNIKYPDVEIKLETFEDVGLAYHRLTVGQGDAVIAYQHPKARLLSDDTAFIVIGKECLSVIVNPLNPVNAISEEQLKNILLGKILDWTEIGGEEGRIRPLAFNTNHHVSSLLATALSLDNIRYSERVFQVRDYKEMASKVAEDKEAVGIILESQVAGDSVKKVQFGDEKVNTIEWCFVFRSRGQSEALKTLIEFTRSPNAESIFAKYLKPLR